MINKNLENVEEIKNLRTQLKGITNEKEYQYKESSEYVNVISKYKEEVKDLKNEIELLTKESEQEKSLLNIFNNYRIKRKF